ncbi:MAG: GAP family protein [Ilumatobacteraceae bacterium]
MGDLVRTLLICGLVSAFEPFTIGGLLIVMAGDRPGPNGRAFVAAGFVVQTSILVVAGLLVGGLVSHDSGAGRSFLGLRVLLGIALIVVGVRLRRPSSKPAEELPAVFARLQHLRPRTAFVAGALFCDYQGPIVGALALAATTDVGTSGQLVAIAGYTVLATGLPLTLVMVTERSTALRQRFERGVASVMSRRRVIGSWLSLGIGVLFVGDAVATWVMAA